MTLRGALSRGIGQQTTFEPEPDVAARHPRPVTGTTLAPLVVAVLDRRRN